MLFHVLEGFLVPHNSCLQLTAAFLLNRYIVHGYTKVLEFLSIGRIILLGVIVPQEQG